MKQNLYKSISYLKSAYYLSQAVTLPLLDRLIQKSKPQPSAQYDQKLLISYIKELKKLLDQDSENISQGLYPASVLTHESLLTHIKRLPMLYFEMLKSAKRRSENQHSDFDSEAKEDLDQLPEYYRRNFHFQPSGYLSKKSADLYDHQVQILFSGAGHAMRRLIIPPMAEWIQLNSKDLKINGRKLKILEVGAGCGSATQFVAQAFPGAEFTLIDLSESYLKEAQKNLNSFKNISTLRTNAEQLPFKDQEFDMVYSVFLFHELPLPVRERVIQESQRVLKQGGFFGLVDSVQKGDQPEFDLMLEDFPKQYHEPFYKNYIQNDIAKLTDHIFERSSETNIGFFSKSVWTIRKSA